MQFNKIKVLFKGSIHSTYHNWTGFFFLILNNAMKFMIKYGK